MVLDVRRRGTSPDAAFRAPALWHRFQKGTGILPRCTQGGLRGHLTPKNLPGPLFGKVGADEDDKVSISADCSGTASPAACPWRHSLSRGLLCRMGKLRSFLATFVDAGPNTECRSTTPVFGCFGFVVFHIVARGAAHLSSGLRSGLSSRIDHLAWTRVWSQVFLSSRSRFLCHVVRKQVVGKVEWHQVESFTLAGFSPPACRSDVAHRSVQPSDYERPSRPGTPGRVDSPAVAH